MTEDGRPSSKTVGKLRPSQVVTMHGPGAVVDLPEISVIVGGLNHWFTQPADRVFEPRLQAFLGKRAFYRPPQAFDGERGGVPSFLFPEWLVCPRCRLLAPFTKFGERTTRGEFHYVCQRSEEHNGARSPDAFPARLMLACSKGHLDDFPWRKWAHGQAPDCGGGDLELLDDGRTGAISDLRVKCKGCSKSNSLSGAFKKDVDFKCSGRRPWLGPKDHEANCKEAPRTLLRGASNAYFSVVASALSIPPWSDPIQSDITPYRDVIEQAGGDFDLFASGVEGGFYRLGDLRERYTLEQIWKAFIAEPETEADLRRKEWESLRQPTAAHAQTAEFEIHDREVPAGLSGFVCRVTAVTRLREVRVLRGFTRIDSRADLGEVSDFKELQISVADIGLKENNWLPGIDLRGEGIFLELDEDRISAWENSAIVQAEAAVMSERFDEMMRQRGETGRQFRGMRYELLHTLAHVLIRELALECGYGSSSLRERIYCSSGDSPMSGILIYTASSDSEGSLGGLVDQASPQRLGQIFEGAFREAAFCAQDPLCGLAEMGGGAHLNGAACHACVLLAETSCEHGNRMLDRSVLVETIGSRGLAFFAGA
jgi:hypothetical protein